MSNNVSTTSLVVGVAAAHSQASDILVAGAMSMAAREYVSVSSQSDTERADLVRECRELAAMYASRGVEPSLARQVAEELMAQAAAAAHPDFKGQVVFVKTTAFARPAEQSPNKGHGHYWYGNAESYFLIGDALGKAMLNLISND